MEINYKLISVFLPTLVNVKKRGSYEKFHTQRMLVNFH